MTRSAVLQMSIVVLMSYTAANASEFASGVLDRPVPLTPAAEATAATGSSAATVSEPNSPAEATTSPLAPALAQIETAAANNDPEGLQAAIQQALADEQELLDTLKRAELTELAENGERAAQIALAEGYAREASLLEFSPAAANDALSDAVRWYSQAASRGFPGAPSLDYAGVKFYPVRAQRDR